MNECVYVATCLLPDLFAQRMIPGNAIYITELIRPVRVRLTAEITRGFDHVKNQLFRGTSVLTWNDRQFRTHRLHLVQLVGAESIRRHDVNAISFGNANQRQ